MTNQLLETDERLCDANDFPSQKEQAFAHTSNDWPPIEPLGHRAPTILTLRQDNLPEFDRELARADREGRRPVLHLDDVAGVSRTRLRGLLRRPHVYIASEVRDASHGLGLAFGAAVLVLAYLTLFVGMLSRG